jgi:class 3 adenylate cyclase
MSAVAAKLATLDVGGAQAQSDSRIREFADAASAFNAMTAGLRWFETYVPKTLVLRLMRQTALGASGADITASAERTLTVMFTDIRGFSTMAERMQASDIAALLNRHFEIVSACIEAEGGTVDKFIGDSVMAFWEAPEPVADHAARAVRAAAAIQAAVITENRARRARGDAPICIRVGLHSGPVVVGNIGSKSRVNYTVVGDTVNAASRLESLAKEIRVAADAEGVECTVLLSEATRVAAGGGFRLRSLGQHRLRGRSGTVEVFELAAAD